MRIWRFFLNGALVRMFGQIIVELLGPEMATISGQFTNFGIYWPYVTVLELAVFFFCLCVALIGLTLAYILANSKFVQVFENRIVIVGNIDFIFSSILGVISGLIVSFYLTQ